MKALLTVLAVAFVPAFLEGIIDDIAMSFIVGFLLIAIVVVVFAAVLFSKRVRNHYPDPED